MPRRLSYSPSNVIKRANRLSLASAVGTVNPIEKSSNRSGRGQGIPAFWPGSDHPDTEGSVGRPPKSPEHAAGATSSTPDVSASRRMQQTQTTHHKENDIGKGPTDYEDAQIKFKKRADEFLKPKTQRNQVKPGFDVGLNCSFKTLGELMSERVKHSMDDDEPEETEEDLLLEPDASAECKKLETEISSVGGAGSSGTSLRGFTIPIGSRQRKKKAKFR